MLSNYAKLLLENSQCTTVPKLIPNLNDKKNYVVLNKNLKLYLKLGLELRKIHKAIKLHQSPWLQNYIEFNTEKCKQASSSFEMEFFINMDVSLNGLSIWAKKELQSLRCMMGKTMSLRCHFLAANGWRLIDWIQNKIKLST